MVEKWASPIGCLPRHDERPADRTVQSARGQTSRGWGNLAEVDGKVLALGDGVGDQGHLQDRIAGRRRRGRDIGQDTCYETAAVTALPGRGLGVPPN